jgi:hypothetical protein
MLDHVFEVYVLSSRYLLANIIPVAHRRYSLPPAVTAAMFFDRRRSIYQRLSTRTA